MKKIKLIHTPTEHTSTVSPVSETQDYDYQHQHKHTDQVWNFTDDVFRIKGQKAIKYVQLAKI